MSMSSESYQGDNCHDTGDWGSTLSCEISIEWSSRSPQDTQQQLECIILGKPEKSTGANRGHIEKQPSDQTQTINTIPNYLRGRYRHRG